ncbi:MAG TPA: AMP-binding protein [Chryseolinea sp.]|nr:AMP-binding protein [Chryseolinea sp.]
MDLYPYDDITVNGRVILIHDILSHNCAEASPFEATLFGFVRQWFDGLTEFQLHTSGSTGAPKPISITRQQMRASARLSAKVLDLRSGAHALVCLDPAYIAGKMMLVRSFELGLHIHFIDPVSNPLASIDEMPIDFCAMVPMQAFTVLRSPHAKKLHSDATLIIGGGVIDQQSHDLLQNLPCSCYATYGMTETISHVALRKLNGRGASPHFTTMPGVEVTLDDRGCLVIHWEILHHDVVTNDMATLIDKRSFIWTGRWDNVINSGGYKVVPEAVERVLTDLFKELNVTNRFFIGSVADAILENKVALFIEGPIANELMLQVSQRLREMVSRYEVPRTILFRSRFVETQTGKINRIATMNLTSSDGDLSV